MSADLPAGVETFLSTAGWGGAEIAPLPGDASFRRYFRIHLNGKSAMLMDAPPPNEDPEPFLRAAKWLDANGLRAPHIYAEDAARALEEILAVLAAREASVAEVGSPLPADTDLRGIIAQLHPADLAYVLEALPLEERQTVWALVRQAPATHDEGDVLLEVNDAVRESLIEDMSRAELVDAVAELEADEVADLAPDLPRDVVEEVASSMDLEEREQLRAAMSYPEDSVGARVVEHSAISWVTGNKFLPFEPRQQFFDCVRYSREVPRRQVRAVLRQTR